MPPISTTDSPHRLSVFSPGVATSTGISRRTPWTQRRSHGCAAWDCSFLHYSGSVQSFTPRRTSKSCRNDEGASVSASGIHTSCTTWALDFAPKPPTWAFVRGIVVPKRRGRGSCPVRAMLRRGSSGRDGGASVLFRGESFCHSSIVSTQDFGHLP